MPKASADMVKFVSRNGRLVTFGFFLQRADALLAESTRPENYGKDLIVASRKELDDLLNQARERANQKAFFP
jgi:hypothetical protein